MDETDEMLGNAGCASGKKEGQVMEPDGKKHNGSCKWRKYDRRDWQG